MLTNVCNSRKGDTLAPRNNQESINKFGRILFDSLLDCTHVLA